MRVLLAEDTQELAAVITYALTHNQYAVDAVSNGVDALEYALSGMYDIIILNRHTLPFREGVLPSYTRYNLFTVLSQVFAFSSAGLKIRRLF